MRRLRLIGILIATIFFASALAQGRQVRHRNTITVAMEAVPNSIIPTVVTGSQSGQISAQVFAALCRLTPKGELIPYLAHAFSYTPDHRGIHIKLRKNANFHDGTPITAEDVAFSIRTAQKIHAFHTAFEQLREIKIESPYDLSLNFSIPQPHFMKMMIP